MEKATRDAFGETLLELGKKNNKIVALSADLQDSTKAILFQKEFSDRFVNVGIAEQDLVGIGAGYALEGFIPYVSSFASFLTTRPFDMIRMLACYNNLNIKIVATHTGVTVGEDGGSAQMLEDIAIMRALPNMVVLCPADAVETKKMVEKIADYNGPVYLRLARAKYPVITDPEKTFEIGKGEILREGNDVTLVGTGLMVSKALEAAEVLASDGIEARVVNMSSIKPIDRDLLIKCAKETGKIMTLEEHQVIGGLGGAVCEVLSAEYPVPVKIIGVENRFGQSGKADELLEEYKLDSKSIVEKAKAFIRG
ncbi:transketolase family protein [Ilyobacter polytropus]|uniref:Transketolase subunit B n=1 Tax=Ilyobacter polytropus (strain ATCC 51220 / DSM 2926 / LMG 16218 / CuHBu1) TaxID=572544 RepID=E3H7V3_ILYPC|nr:transketolase family protein [Ilyobacter polytropus]ADO82905.1 transketolase subunit B [Ilyobacter polytropus DSM 2926]